MKVNKNTLSLSKEINRIRNEIIVISNTSEDAMDIRMRLDDNLKNIDNMKYPPNLSEYKDVINNVAKTQAILSAKIELGDLLSDELTDELDKQLQFSNSAKNHIKKLEDLLERNNVTPPKFEVMSLNTSVVSNSYDRVGNEVIR